MHYKKLITILLLSIVLVVHRPVKAIETGQVARAVVIATLGYGLIKYKPWRYFYSATKLEQVQKIIEKVQNHKLMYNYNLSDQRWLKLIMDYWSLHFQPLDKAQFFFEKIVRDLKKADLLLSGALIEEDNCSKDCIVHQRKQLYFLENKAVRAIAIIQERQSLEKKERQRKTSQASFDRLKKRISLISQIRAIQHSYQDKEIYDFIEISFFDNRWPLVQAKSYFTKLSHELRGILSELSILLNESRMLRDEIAGEMSHVQILIDRVINVLRVIEHCKYEYIAQEKAHQLHAAYERQLACERKEAARRRKQERICLQRIKDKEQRLKREREKFWYEQRRDAQRWKKKTFVPIVEIVQIETHIHDQPKAPIVHLQPATTIIIEKEPKATAQTVSQKPKKVEKSKEAFEQAEPQAAEDSLQGRWEEALFDSFNQF